ncbi:zinc finger protein 652-B [Strongylocentrotus purpuratus]|uniref:C2H2-type domain-containing protein n=1 Tax=Strongylocentrotus purpuratus TaxID=7668 RepID=A0A7M7GQT3_STRPU|nr:zinc finger protein 652-B [Strongylocentrotus purpuratus]|eukprot:XP_003728874.1 PREDICTED: zinc finger protein 652-B [Strongylocentrotus purpuratus]
MTRLRMTKHLEEWMEVRKIYSAEIDKINANLGVKPLKLPASHDEFAGHLLDVHQHWCKACVPTSTASTKRSLHTKVSVCVDQSTQTMSFFDCSPPVKLVPPLTRIQPSGPQKIRIDRVSNPLSNGPKTPNIKVILVKKSTAGVLRQDSGSTPQALNNLMQLGSNLQAAQPLQGNLTGPSQPPASGVLHGLLTGKNISGSTQVVKMEPVESMEDFEQLPKQEFCQAKCIDEKDNTEDYIYDDGSMTLDDGKELDPDKKLSRATDLPVAVVVKEEVLSDLEQSNLVHSDKEESLFDPRQDREFGSDSKLEHSETGWHEEEEEEKEEDEDEEDEMEDDMEIDYEPTHDPSASMPQHLSQNSKDKPGSSQAKSSKCLDDQDSLEYGGDSDEDVEGEPALKRKKHQSKASKPAFKFPEACPICSEAWKEKPDIMRHLHKHIPIDKGPEAIKDAVQSIESQLKGHDFDMGWCGECKKLLLRYRSHMNRIHNKHRDRVVLCQQCGKMIRSFCIKQHQISHLEVKESDYVQCPECPSRFKHRMYLRGHIRDVHSRKGFECSTCGKILKNRECFRRHEAIHSGVKPYPCSKCDKSFTQRSNLKVHMRQHTGDKPYVCELCEMAFTNKVSLKNHKKKLHGIDWWKERESFEKEDD